jgi:hypothetical protein
MRVIDVGSICSLYGQQLPKAFNRKGRKGRTAANDSGC